MEVSGIENWIYLILLEGKNCYFLVPFKIIGKKKYEHLLKCEYHF